MKEFSIKDFLLKSDDEIKNKVDELCKNEISEKAHEHEKYQGLSIGEAAKKHVEKALTTKPEDPPAIRLMRVVLSSHRKEERVTGFMATVRSDRPELTLSQLHGELEANNYVTFAAKGWWHKDQLKFDTLKALVTFFLGMYDDVDITDEDLFQRWVKGCELISWEENPLRKIANVGLATFQHLRLSFGVNTVKPDHWVKQVLAKEFGAKLSGLRAIRAVEEIADITGREIREIDQIFVKYGSSGYLSTNSKTEASPINAVERLSHDKNYRILRRLDLTNVLVPPPVGRVLATGVVVDTETTGLDPDIDRIIEIGLIVFRYDPISGKPVQIVDSYTAFEDPGCPLSQQTNSITGITDAMVAKQRINDRQVNELVSGADIVIAHNAQFDRAFLEKRLPVFIDLPWGCSLRDVAWSEEKIGSRKLEFIAFKLGFFFDAHRALQDCEALLGVISLPLPASGLPALKQLIGSLSRIDYTVLALSAPFAKRDILKARLYQWNADRKCWQKALDRSASFHNELIWLQSAIYDDFTARIDVEERCAKSRYSPRPVVPITKTVRP